MAADPRIFIRQRAAELGFGVCRFASASAPWSAGEKLAHFVEACLLYTSPSPRDS